MFKWMTYRAYPNKGQEALLRKAFGCARWAYNWTIDQRMRLILAFAVSNAGWYSFFKKLEYKCEWYGVHFLKCGRFDPSTKMCSRCGYIKNDITLNIRKWTCPECGAKHDRDINAAVNILNFAVASTVNGRGDKVRLEFTDGVYPAVEPELMSEKRQSMYFVDDRVR